MKIFRVKSPADQNIFTLTEKILFTREFHPGMKRVEFHPGMKFDLKENLTLSMKRIVRFIIFSQLLKQY